MGRVSRCFIVILLFSLALFICNDLSTFEVLQYSDQVKQEVCTKKSSVVGKRKFGKTVVDMPVSTTYVCYFMRNATTVPGACVESCITEIKDGPVDFLCYVHHSRPKDNKEFLSGDVIVTHYNQPPPPHGTNGPPYLTLYYTGESNKSNRILGIDRYHEYDMVVSLHQHRLLYFTWVLEYQEQFIKIIQNNIQGKGPTKDAIWSDWQGRSPAIAVFISGCYTMRQKLLELLSTVYQFHSYGACYKNKNITEKCKRFKKYEQKICVLRDYKYVLTLENTKEPDYVTEKVYHVLLAGAIPLYWGAPNIHKFVPSGRKSYIDLNEYISDEWNNEMNDSIKERALSSLKKLSDRLQRLESDKAAAMDLLQWRLSRSEKEWGEDFCNTLHHTAPICGVCAEAYKRRSQIIH